MISYSAVVTNTGTTTLGDPAVTATTFTGGGPRPVFDCPPTALAPGGETTCTARYTVTQADLDRGSVVLTVESSGTSPGQPGRVVSEPDTVTSRADLVDGLVVEMLKSRDAARARKDYSAADGVRDALTRLGIVIEDTPQGPRWSLRSGS